MTPTAVEIQRKIKALLQRRKLAKQKEKEARKQAAWQEEDHVFA